MRYHARRAAQRSQAFLRVLAKVGLGWWPVVVLNTARQDYSNEIVASPKGYTREVVDRRSRITLSAPLQNSLIKLSLESLATTDMRLRVELNSRMAMISKRTTWPRMFTKQTCPSIVSLSTTILHYAKEATDGQQTIIVAGTRAYRLAFVEVIVEILGGDHQSAFIGRRRLIFNGIVSR